MFQMSSKTYTLTPGSSSDFRCIETNILQILHFVVKNLKPQIKKSSTVQCFIEIFPYYLQKIDFCVDIFSQFPIMYQLLLNYSCWGKEEKYLKNYRKMIYQYNSLLLPMETI